jgi:hypothetical protein
VLPRGRVTEEEALALGVVSDPQEARGRPSLYDETVAALILSRISAGESLRSICRSEELPAESTVRLWALQDREGFSARLARAWELRAEHIADELLEIADDGSGDTWTDEEGIVRTNNDVIQRSRLRVDTRKWLLSKVLPRKYGEKLELSGDAEQPVEIVVRYAK